MKKRLLSIVTTLALCLSLLPATVLAEEHTCADGDVTDHYCDTCWEHIPTLCTDEDSDHLCDVCSDTLSECVDDVDHDHWCDTCGDVTYRTDPLDSGYYSCEAGCGAVMVSVTGDYTELNYHGFEEGTLVDGTAEISVYVPNYHNAYDGIDFELAENGVVTVFWTDEEGEIFENHTVEDVKLVDGKAVISFTGLPIEILHHGNLLYKPADPTMYLPERNGMVLEYQDNAYRLSVDSNVDCTINGLYEDNLYLFAGTEVSVIPLGDFWGELTWSYEEDSAKPEHEVVGSIVNFTMPEGDVEAILEYICVTCIDENGDHWCDFCESRISECADEDGDHHCDVCWEYLSDLCTDGEDIDHVCGVCGEYLSELCRDENGDHICDTETCGTVIGPCKDEDPEDHFCDNEDCGNEMSTCEECDWNDDNICDLCGKNIHPGAGELNIDAVAGDGTITVTWDALEDAGTDKVASYTVFCCLEDTFEPLQQAVYEPGSESYAHTFSDLENNVVYDVSVEATYSQNEDPFSATATDTVTALPGAPTILSVECGYHSVTVEWEAPENKGFPDILYYVITAEQNGMGVGTEVEATGEETMRCTLNGILNGQTYQINVTAVNDIGQGAVATTTVEIPLIPYQLEIGGVVVTEENMDDVLGDGTVSLNPRTATLTLNNAHINVTEGNYGIRSKTALKLELIGENSITCSGVYGIHSTDDVTVSGSGSLDITANDVGIYIAGGYEVGGLYLKDDVTLNVTSGNVTSGNSYGVRVDDVLEVRDNATLIATAGTAPERSCGIYAYDQFNVYDNAVVTATGADQSVDLNTDCDGIRATHITIEGGTVTATGGKAATTNGIFTQTFDMHGGTLTAVSGSTAGGTCFGPSTALQATRSFNMTDGVINATSGSAGNDTSCGVLVSNGELRMEGGSLFAQSGEANFSYGVKASQLSLFSDGYIEAEGAEGVWCSNGINVEGNLIVDNGGKILAKAATAETYSYGLQAFEMTISDSDIEAVAGSAANNYGLWAFGSMDIFCNRIRLNPHAPGFIGTSVTASAENGYAVYSRTGVEIADTLAISSPEGGSVAVVGEDELSRYYTVAAADGTAAQSVELDILTYNVSIEGLDLSYDMAVEVPAGWSVNEAYCEMYEVEDFSEILNTDRSGYTFYGWYTNENYASGSEFTFDDDITSDITIYARWTRNSSGGSSGGSSNTTTKTEKNEDGSTTTTTTNKKTGEVTETVKTPDGVTGTVVTDKNGEVTEASAKVPASAAKDAEKSGEAVKLPIEVEATENTEDSLEIKIDIPSGGAKMEIPVEDVTPGTVVVIVNKDGTEEIVKTCTMTENGVVVTLEKDATIKVIDNSKDFDDVTDSFWAGDSIDFVTAREIFGGISATTFSPNGTMTRQAMWMVLARMSGEDPTDMAEAKAWAVENGISDGSAPTNAVTRQQFVTMLWRWHGEPESDHSVDHHVDAHTISSYAEEAVAWAVEHGIKGGYPDGTLRPHGTATRAHVATFIQRFYEYVVQ